MTKHDLSLSCQKRHGASRINNADGRVDKIVASKKIVKSKSPRQPVTAGPKELSFWQADSISVFKVLGKKEAKKAVRLHFKGELNEAGAYLSGS